LEVSLVGSPIFQLTSVLAVASPQGRGIVLRVLPSDNWEKSQ
jgi:hypothetical protein